MKAGGTEQDSSLYNIVTGGQVVKRRLTTTGAQVQVYLPDRGRTTNWIPVMSHASKGWIHYVPPPQIGDEVTVLAHPTGIENAKVIGTNCNPANPSFQPHSINAWALQGPDGSYFEYDPDTGCLNINGVATVFLKSLGQVLINVGGDCDLNVTKNLNANVQGNANIDVTGDTTLQSAANTIKGPTTFTDAVTMDSTLTVDGNVTVTGATTTVQNITISGTETGGGST